MLKMNVSNMCKEVHRVRVLYVHVFVSVYNFLRWNKIIKYKKKKKKKLGLQWKLYHIHNKGVSRVRR